MQFTSVAFIIFLAILILIYYLLPKKCQWVVLLVASYIFYLFAGVRYLAFILFTTITTYLVTVYMDGNNKKKDAYLAEHKKDMSKDEKKEYKHKMKVKNRIWFIITIAVNFAILFFCKALLVEPLRSAFSKGTLSFLTLGLPMGMSFYMFQSMGYVIDVYREKAEALKNPFKTALFTAFFPQLIQGPISKFEQLKDSLFSEHAFDRKQIAFGLERMLWGFFKKMVIADRIAVAVGSLNSSENRGVAFFVMVMFYSIQLYADFSGGIDIAIGAAQALGITLPENFIRPLFSTNIADYWRRWHISLNEWMRSYIFYPITVSGPLLKFSVKARKKVGKLGMRLPIYIGSVLCWLGTGVWHGFSLNFIIWGMLNCVIIVISEELAPLYEKFHNRTHLKGRIGYTVFEVIRTFLMMSIIRITDLFGNNMGDYFSRVASLFYTFNFNVLTDGTLMNLGLQARDYIIVACGVAVMYLVSGVQAKKGSVREQMLRIPRAARYAIIIAMLLAVILFGSYGMGYDQANFIYNKF